MGPVSATLGGAEREGEREGRERGGRDRERRERQRERDNRVIVLKVTTLINYWVKGHHSNKLLCIDLLLRIRFFGGAFLLFLLQFGLSFI